MNDVPDGAGADAAARRSGAKYKSLVEHAVYGIYISSIEGRFLDVNPALVRMLGYDSEDELLALDLADAVYADPTDRNHAIAQFRDARLISGLEMRWIRKDGTPITVRLSGRPLHDEAGKRVGFEMMAEDVTAQHSLEAQLRHAQKMEAIGQLTSGIAHDFNNLLTVVLSNAELLAEAIPASRADAHMDLEETKRAARRGAELIRKLMTFSRTQELEFVPLDLSEQMRELSRMLRRLVPEYIQMQIVAQEPVGRIVADAGAIQQVIFNLATNARDAMPDGGVLRIQVCRRWIDQEHVVTHGWGRPGEYATIFVSDTGTGMDKRTKERLFEPFFSTKPSGAGTGLGLAMVYGLVKQHDGYIDVHSKLGEGTTFKIYFPVARDETASAVVPEEPTPRGGNETILLAEDEPAIRRSATRVLEHVGYRVVCAEDGEAALTLFWEYGTAIDLILSDMVMPKMGGRALYEAVRSTGAQVPFLFVSGYIRRDIGESVKLADTVVFLHKPWTVQGLLRAVRELLDRVDR